MISTILLHKILQQKLLDQGVEQEESSNANRERKTERPKKTGLRLNTSVLSRRNRCSFHDMNFLLNKAKYIHSKRSRKNTLGGEAPLPKDSIVLHIKFARL